MASEKSSNVTTDHDEIRKWVEDRGGWPATVKGTSRGSEEAGLLRIDFPGYSGGERLERISWDEFFEKFEESNLAFLYQESTSGGKTSRFSKFISRERVEAGGSSVGAGMKGESTERTKGANGMDIFELIEAEHQTILGILDKLSSSSGDKEKLFQQFRDEIMEHTFGEETVLYPLLGEAGNRKKMLLAIEEHNAVKLEMGEMEKMSSDDERWEAKLALVEELLENHIDVEEDELFELVRDVIDEEQANEMGKQFEQAKENMKARSK